MKTIVAGSRTMNSGPVYQAIKTCSWEITEVVSGGANGADMWGEVFAESLNIPIMRFPANWKKHGRRAGPIRNRKMAKYADALILIWDGKSPGSANMLKQAKENGLEIREVIV